MCCFLDSSLVPFCVALQLELDKFQLAYFDYVAAIKFKSLFKEMGDTIFDKNDDIFSAQQFLD